MPAEPPKADEIGCSVEGTTESISSKTGQVLPYKELIIYD